MVHGHVVIGARELWGKETPFGIDRDDLAHHLYIIGMSGSGKTTLLRNLIVQDIEAGHGVGLLDPHGDLADELLDFIPRRRIDDAIYFNPADVDFPIPFNVLRSRGAPPHLVASGIVSALKGIWSESWGPRLEYILYATLAALLDCDDVSMLGVQRMLIDARYRAWVVRQAKDPMVRSFWINEFENYDRRFLQEAIAPIQNKVGQLLMSPQLRNIIGQVRSKIDPRSIMDNGHIFVANLSTGRIGEHESDLLGALLVSQFQLAAMSRVDVPERKRRPFHLYVDEFQSFTSEAFASILSEARKYGLRLILSHQFLGQLGKEMSEAIFGNVGSVIAFRVGQGDGEILEREFGHAYRHSQFTQLGNHEICVKLMAQGKQVDPFIGRTLPPSGRRNSRRETIVRSSRERYGSRREIVENKINRWIGDGLPHTFF